VTRLRRLLTGRSLRVGIGYFRGPRWASNVRRWWVLFRNPHADIRFGKNCYLGPGFSLHMPFGGTFVAGDAVEFRRGFRAELAGPESVIEIGSGCGFTYYSLIQCGQRISIGERVMFGQSSLVVDGNHRYRDLTKPMLAQGYDLRPIRIEDDVTTTTKCTIMASIGTRAFVGANSVVTRDIPPYTVAVGAPARVVDYFGPPGQEPEDWQGDGAQGERDSTSRSERSG
jgi:acetyltransferase-like isoleucine patch superfamily enzyme